MELKEPGDEQRSVLPAGGWAPGWSDVIAELHGRIAPRFRRAAVRERAGRYLLGLLARVERKNGWQLAEALGETGPQGIQRLLNGAVWNAEGVRDDLRRFVVDALGEASTGLLIVDETGFLKKGRHSCGVARQYTGTAGGTENAQVGVFLAYASAKGAAFIDRSVYLPRAWTRDAPRRAAAGIPKGIRFATKLTLAQRMLARAFAARVPARWVTADSGYGRSRAFRRWLERRDQPYVVMIPKTTAIQYATRRERAEQLGERLPDGAWVAIPSGGEGRQAPAHQWVCLPLSEPCAPGRRRWLLIRRPIEDPCDLAYYLAYGRDETPVDELVRVAERRWAIEEGFAEAKGEVGLDQYEVRTWTAWHRFTTLALLAHAALVVLRARAVAAEAELAAAAAARPAEQAVRQKGDLQPARRPRPGSSRSRCRKSAARCWRCARRRSGGPSTWVGRGGDAPTKPSPPAVTRPRAHGARAPARPRAPRPIPVPEVRPWRRSLRPRCTGRSPTPSGAASCRCSRRSARRLGARAMTTARC